MRIWGLMCKKTVLFEKKITFFEKMWGRVEKSGEKFVILNPKSKLKKLK